MASSIPAPTEAPPTPPSFPPPQLPVSQFINLDSLDADLKSQALAVQNASRPVYSGSLLDPESPLSPAVPDEAETPPPGYDDLHISDQQSAPESVSASPPAPAYLPPLPPASDASQTVDANLPPTITVSQLDADLPPAVAVSQLDEPSSLPPTLPSISISDDEDESQHEGGDSNMFFFSSSSQPKVPKSESKPNTLKKTRGRPNDEAPVKQNAVSMPQPSGLLPSAPDLPRSCSVSSQPPTSVVTACYSDTASSQPAEPFPEIPDDHQQSLQPQHQHNQSLEVQAVGHEASATVRPSSRSHKSNSSDASLNSTLAVPHRERRKSWLPSLGSRRSKSREPETGPRSVAWILSPDSHVDYNVGHLINCEKVPELWDDNGNLYIYLSSLHSGKEASFKVCSSIIEQSPVLGSMIKIQMASPSSARSRALSFGDRNLPTAADADQTNSPPASPPLLRGDDTHLYLPVGCGADGKPELERLISLRNLFALLTGNPLVATHNCSTVCSVLLQVAELLHEFEFGFSTGGNNSFGDAVDSGILFCADQNSLSDVRFSREKTIEALVLGEQLRFWPLYNEAFCHAVGKYPALHDLKTSPLWSKVSPNTLQRLERAHLDLVNRQNSVNTRLEQFDFPSLFSGIGNSTSHGEYRNVRFKSWRASFSEMRAFVLKFYRTKFGSWPPRAGSRRNPFSESGLNRMVLKIVYDDLCSAYDLLVNRNSRTTRSGEDGPALPIGGASSIATAPLPTAEASIRALRQILSEFDESSPPVLPPVPFDAPKLPTMAAISDRFNDMSPKDQARFQRSVHSAELQTILTSSHNIDNERPYGSPFLSAFAAFELREAKSHRTESELTEMRVGHWLFLYVVLQSMPMLVIDAPGLQHTDGVEYFLCEPPQGRAPWVEDAGEVRKAWFQTAGGAGPLVELSADVLLYSVEATYHRSHCWLAANKWDSEKVLSPQAVAPAVTSPRSGSISGSTFVTLPDLPMRSVESGSGGSASALGLASLGSSSNPSVSTLSTTASATESRATATGSNQSSPHMIPTLNSEGTALADYQLDGPSISSPTSTQYSPTLMPLNQLGQPVPALSLPQEPQTPPQYPQPQRRENYHELQERANLRHASIGWALEPVSLENDPSQQDDFQEPISANTRRIASAGNLRVTTDMSGNANCASNGQRPRRGSTRVTSPGSLTVPGVTFNSESTFDSILNSIDADAGKKVNKRKSFLSFM